MEVSASIPQTVLTPALAIMEGPAKEVPDQEGLNEQWRLRANGQIDSLACLFSSIAILALLGILLICVYSFLFYYDEIGLRLEGKATATYITVTIVLSAVGAVYVQRRIQRNQVADDDCKEGKKRQEQENQRRLVALFFAFLASLITLQMIWCSISHQRTVEASVTEAIGVRVDHLVTKTRRNHALRGNIGPLSVRED